MEGDTVTVKVIQCSWNRRTQGYEAAVARDFAELGLKVVWQPFWSGSLQDRLDEALKKALKGGKPISEEDYVEDQRQVELRRGHR